MEIAQRGMPFVSMVTRVQLPLIARRCQSVCDFWSTTVRRFVSLLVCAYLSAYLSLCLLIPPSAPMSVCLPIVYAALRIRRLSFQLTISSNAVDLNSFSRTLGRGWASEWVRACSNSARGGAEGMQRLALSCTSYSLKRAPKPVPLRAGWAPVMPRLLCGTPMTP